MPSMTFCLNIKILLPRKNHTFMQKSRSLLNSAGGLGVAVSSPVGVQGAKPPEAQTVLQILVDLERCRNHSCDFLWLAKI